jgi:hypothetical protein
MDRSKFGSWPARGPEDGNMSDHRSPRSDSDRRSLRCTNDRQAFGEPPVKLKPQMIAMKVGT